MVRSRRKQVSIPVNSLPEQSKASTEMGLWPDGGQKPQALRVRNREQAITVPLSELDAVIDCPPMSPVPAAPEWLLGVAAYKGALLPVVDLAVACGDRVSAAGKPGDQLLLVEAGLHRFAFSVDAIISQTPDSLPSDGSAISLRALVAQLLGTAPAGNPCSAEPIAR